MRIMGSWWPEVRRGSCAAVRRAATMLVRAWRVVGPRDLHTYTGLTLVGVGVRAIYPPAALIVVGTALVYIGLVHPYVATRLSRDGD